MAGNFADVLLLCGLGATATLLFLPGLSQLQLVHPVASFSIFLIIGRLLQAAHLTHPAAHLSHPR